MKLDNEIPGDENLHETPGQAQPYAGAVYSRRRLVALRGWLAVLEIIPEGEAYRVTLSDPDGQELFTAPASALRVAAAPPMSFRIQYGEERWWLWGVSFLTRKELERRRRRFARDDVNLLPPKAPETEKRTYRWMMSNRVAQQHVWRVWWLAALRLAGAQVE